MASFATALITAGLAILAKVLYDIWSGWRQQRGIAAAIAGELGAYASLMKLDEGGPNLRAMIGVEQTLRSRRLRALSALPNSHPVFDKLADKIGLLSTEEALGISRTYNVVTGFRLLWMNFSSDRFLEADNDFQVAFIETLAKMLDDEAPKAKALIAQLLRTANRGFLDYLANNDARPNV